MPGSPIKCLPWLLAVTTAVAPLHAAPDPFATAYQDEGRRAQSVACLTDAIVHEAGFEPLEGQQAVAQVIMNRLRDPIFPKTVCGVIYQGSERRTGCQFTFTCDGSLRRATSQRVAAAARYVAEAALDGALPDRVADATFYHAYYVAPRWAPRLTRVAKIGAHIFYRAGRGQAGGFARPLGDMAGEPQQARPGQPFAPWGLPMAIDSTIKTGPASF